MSFMTGLSQDSDPNQQRTSALLCTPCTSNVEILWCWLPSLHVSGSTQKLDRCEAHNLLMASFCSIHGDFSSRLCTLISKASFALIIILHHEPTSWPCYQGPGLGPSEQPVGRNNQSSYPLCLETAGGH